MVRRSPLRLLALAALGAAFVPPRQRHLAVRVRADEIEDAAAPAERAAPEVNSGAEAVELLFKDPEGYKLARDEYNRKMKEEILEEGAPDRAFLLQAAAVGLGSFLFGLYGPKPKNN
mmetsp:Transcript_22819/g.59416  ORF Transcript_22819/g.59416 Transcript_22819/m.59416 type:complete len:117 (+) Transcript_22819:136-486(+)